METGIQKCIQAKKDAEYEKAAQKARMQAHAKHEVESMYKWIESNG